MHAFALCIKTSVLSNFLSCFSLCIFLGTYHQYDTVVYPQKTKISKTFTEKFKETVGTIGGAIGSFFGRSSTSQGDTTKETDFKPLALQKMSELCLQTYLAEYEEKLCSGDLLSVQSTAEDINHIFESLYHPVIIRQYSSLPFYKYLDGSFKEVRTLFFFPSLCKFKLSVIIFTVSDPKRMVRVNC